MDQSEYFSQWDGLMTRMIHWYIDSEVSLGVVLEKSAANQYLPSVTSTYMLKLCMVEFLNQQ